MKILFLFTYNKGLLSDFFMDLGQQLNEEGHIVKVFSLKKHPGQFRVGEIEITVVKKGNYISDYFHIFKAVREISPDVIISNFSSANPALLAGRLLGVKKNYVWVHSLKKHGDPGKHVIIIKRQFYKLAEKLIVNSLILEKELKEVFHVQGSKIIPIPFWSNIQEVQTISLNIHRKENQLLIGCPGRFTKIKNQHVVIEALAKVKARSSKNIKLYLAGDGPIRKDLKSQVNSMDLEEEVNFLGNLSAGEMKEFYRAMDVIVLPSLFESFGLVFIEALSLGTPVLVSERFGALDFIDKRDEAIRQIIFDPEDDEGLAEKISEFINREGVDRNFYKAIYSNHFNKEKIYKDVRDVLLN